MKYAAEQHATRSGVPCTIVRATAFLELWIELLEQTAGRSGRPLVFGRGTTRSTSFPSSTSPPLVERAVIDPATRGETLEIGGPENLTFNQLAQAVQTPLDARRRRETLPSTDAAPDGHHRRTQSSRSSVGRPAPPLPWTEWISPLTPPRSTTATPSFPAPRPPKSSPVVAKQNSRSPPAGERNRECGSAPRHTARAQIRRNGTLIPASARPGRRPTQRNPTEGKYHEPKSQNDTAACSTGACCVGGAATGCGLDDPGKRATLDGEYTQHPGALRDGHWRVVELPQPRPQRFGQPLCR